MLPKVNVLKPTIHAIEINNKRKSALHLIFEENIKYIAVAKGGRNIIANGGCKIIPTNGNTGELCLITTDTNTSAPIMLKPRTKRQAIIIFFDFSSTIICYLVSNIFTITPQ
jgi:hypothetical protein